MDRQEVLKSAAKAKTERMVTEDLQPLEQKAGDRKARAKSDSDKQRIAARLRRGATLAI
ncbi:MAG: hypothetical protein KGS61_05985 [Verrucomicrobia bacterium]|nr:hypothetical protein [Verrucomicrobiota bacterium]